MRSESTAHPNHPIPAVVAVVLHEDSVLLIQRAQSPNAGCWAFPGGKIAFGETLEEAALRELMEETGVHAAAHRAFAAFDVFDSDEDGRLQRHYVVTALLCDWISGEPCAADDAADARWVPAEGLATTHLPLSRDVARLALEALDLKRRRDSA